MSRRALTSVFKNAKRSQKPGLAPIGSDWPTKTRCLTNQIHKKSEAKLPRYHDLFVVEFPSTQNEVCVKKNRD